METQQIHYKTPQGIILGLNQKFLRELKEDPNQTYSVQELSRLFSMKVQELNLLAKQEEIKLEEWDKKLPMLNKEHVQEIKDLTLEQMDKGTRCPTCKSFIKRYKRKLNSSMAWTLILMYKYFKQPDHKEWLHVEDYMKSLQGIPVSLRGDFPKLRYFGLIKEKDNPEGSENEYDANNPEDQENPNKMVGYYKILQKGIDFVENKIKVPKHIFLYNGEFLGFSNEDTTQ